MENKNVPYIVYESAMSRMERTMKKLWILCIILIALLVGSNIAWLHYESQWEDIVVTQETDGNGINNYSDNYSTIINNIDGEAND